MIHATLKRTISNEYGTFGTLQITDRDIICRTLERLWLNNETDVSCIPAGTYDVVPHISARFGSVHKILKVPERTDILFHRGNFVTDTEGCILVGLHKGKINNIPAVTDSRGAWRKFKKLFGDKAFKLTITNNY